MTMLLLTSLIDGLSGLDLTSVDVQTIAPGLVDLGLIKLTALHSPSAIADSTSSHWVLAQYFDTDVFAGARAWWAEFVSSGNIWTLIFGIVLGYLLRALTSYG